MTPTSATGNDRRAAGFTLVELLVVLVVLGLAGGAVLLSLPADSSRLPRQAERLAAHLQHAREEAVLGNRAIAVRVDARGYRFQEQRRGRWRPLEQAPFAPRRFAEGIAAGFAGREDHARFEFDSTGLALPASVDLADGSGRVRIALDLSGEVSLHALAP